MVCRRGAIENEVGVPYRPRYAGSCAHFRVPAHLKGHLCTESLQNFFDWESCTGREHRLQTLSPRWEVGLCEFGVFMVSLIPEVVKTGILDCYDLGLNGGRGGQEGP